MKSESLHMDPTDEGITHFGHSAWINEGGSDMETYSMKMCLHSIPRYYAS